MSSALFPAAAARRVEDDRLTAILAAADARVRQAGVAPDLDLADFRSELAGFDFAVPRPLSELSDWAIAQLEHGATHMTHPRYLGLFNPAPSFPAQCADRIIATFNPQLASATTSPAAVAIEAHVVQAIARRAGMRAGAGGHFTSGGSEANGTALICALSRAEPAFADIGSRAFSGQPTFYISADSHLAWIKLAHMAGIGRNGARLVRTEADGSMSVSSLSQMMADDRRDGCRPVMVVATAGTTNAGAVDPVDACRAAADAHGAWCHVDAAWGGAAIASERMASLLGEIGRADSITIDAHKWFATTMGCGMILVAEPAILAATFDVRTSFMTSHEPSVDPYLTTTQWSRRFVGLRLFHALGAAGWPGYAAHVERAAELARHLAATMTTRRWTVPNDPALAVVCLIPPAGSLPVKTIVARVVSSGAAWVSVGRFAGQDVIRACITNGETSEADIEVTAQALEAAAIPK